MLPVTLLELLQALDYRPNEHVSVNHRRPGGTFTSRTLPAEQATFEHLDDADVWFGVNPVTPGVRGRGTAADVTRLAGIWADLDVKPGGCTDIDEARTIVDDLSQMLGTRPVAITYSGHGAQPIWAVEDHNLDDTNRNTAKALLRRFGRLVAHVASVRGAAIDSVYDLPRVLRAPGSTNHKSAPVAVLTITDNGRPLEVAEILDTLTAYNVPELAGDDEDLGAPVTDPDTWTWATHTCSYAGKTIREWAKETPAARHPWLVGNAVRLAAMHAHGCVTQIEHDTARAMLAHRFQQLLTLAPAREPARGEIAEAFSWGTARAAAMPPDRVARELGDHPHLTAAQVAGDPYDTRLPPTGTDPPDSPTPRQAVHTVARPLDVSHAGRHYGPTEDGTAQALVHLHAATLRYCPQRGSWLRWTGSRWAWDEAETVRELVRGIARDLPGGEGWSSYKRRALSAAGVTGVVRLAQTDPHITVHLNQLDARPYELNTPAGIIDLRAGTVRPADPAALHSRSTTTAPDFEHRSPLLDRFLATTFGGDRDLTGYVQRLLGLSATGRVLEQILPFAHGAGANGKSTLYESVMYALGIGDGGYAISAPSEMLMIRKHEAHPAELAQLAGARLVVCSELEDGQRFAEARIKQLTGRDSINARFMRRDPFTFTPSHTFVLLGNHKPAAATGGPAFWRRVAMIPFDHVVAEPDRDPHLGEKLAEQAPAILAWLARGAADYLYAGLRTPEIARAATASYASEQDTIGRFLDDRCHLVAGMTTATRDVRAAYEQWCHETGEDPVSAKRLTQELRDRFHIEDTRSNGIRRYTGIGIVPEPGTAGAADEPQTARNEDWYR